MRNPSFAWPLLLLLGACSDRTAGTDCPAGSRLIDGACRTTCAEDRDCLSSERCDPIEGVCLAGARADAGNGGNKDAGKPGDATVSRDASAGDREIIDEGVRQDASDSPDSGDSPDGGGDVDAGPDCRSLSETECTQESGCRRHSCPGCYGQTSYLGCYGPNDLPPGCPAIQCAPCSDLDEAACRATNYCRLDGCPDCSGTTPFTRCSEPNDPPPSCPQPICCSAYQTETECDADPQCHPVYVEDPNNGCGCPTAGCCQKFNFCGEGATAQCTGAVNCPMVEPVCGGLHTIGFRNNCYEGCVRIADCL